MFDVSSNSVVKRLSTAVSIVYCDPKCMNYLKQDKSASGMLFRLCESAGMLGAKLSPQFLIERHVLPVDFIKFTFSYISRADNDIYFKGQTAFEFGILIRADISFIGRIAAQMECMTAASCAALQLFEKLHVSHHVQIGSVKLIPRKQEESIVTSVYNNRNCAVLVCSDSIGRGDRVDKSGLILKEYLTRNQADLVDYIVLDCEVQRISRQISKWTAQRVPFIFTCGSTGLGRQDVVVEALEPLLEKKCEGVVHAIYTHGQMQTSKAMFSRILAGTIGESFVLTLPGSTSGIKESLDAILPDLFYARKMLLASNS